MAGRRWDRNERDRRARSDSRPEFETEWTTAELDDAPKERAGAAPEDGPRWVVPDAVDYPGHELCELSPVLTYVDFLDDYWETGQWRVECACGEQWLAPSELGGARLWRSHAARHPTRLGLVEVARAATADASLDSWRLVPDLRTWQRDALQAWERAGHGGVVEAATGTGKTMVAFAAIAALRAEHGDDLRVACVVPTVVLARQWRDALTTHLRIPARQIGEQHSRASLEWKSSQPVLITVLNTARTHLRPVLQTWNRAGHKTFLIVDECHRSGSQTNAQIFTEGVDFSLGLSATPERTDLGHLEVVYPGLGPPVYSYPLRQALADGVLADLRSVNLYVDFNAVEQAEWDDVGRRIAAAMQRLLDGRPELRRYPEGKLWAVISRLARDSDMDATVIVGLLADRRRLLAGCDARRRCHDAIVEWIASRNERTLMFHETIEQAKAGHRLLKLAGVRAGLEHSQLAGANRAETLKRFRRGADRVLVTVRSLDEGLDVPDASVAVIACGSRSTRQRIQRLGRILRPGDDKRAVAVTILVRGTPEESHIGRRDGELLGAERVVHHRWPAVEVRDALTGPSSYRPRPTERRLSDVLQALELDVTR